MASRNRRFSCGCCERSDGASIATHRITDQSTQGGMPLLPHLCMKHFPRPVRRPEPVMTLFSYVCMKNFRHPAPNSDKRRRVESPPPPPNSMLVFIFLDFQKKYFTTFSCQMSTLIRGGGGRGVAVLFGAYCRVNGS